MPAGSTIRVSHISISGKPAGMGVWHPDLPVQAAPQPPQSVHRDGVEADPQYAPPQPKPGHGGTVASSTSAGVYPPSGEPVPGHK